MEISSKSVPTAASEFATLFVALELSKATWLIGLHSPIVDKVGEHAIDGGDVDGLLALIAKKRAAAQAKLGCPVRVVCCYEAGYDGFWLHRVLVAHGIENHVLDAASVLVNRRGRRAKTDRLDLAGLLRTLMAFARGEHQVCRIVRVPGIADEDRRRLTRERQRLVVERGAHVSRIKGLLMLHGVRTFMPARRDWKQRLAGLRGADGTALPSRLGAEVERECRRLWLVIEMIGQVEQEQAREVEQATGPAQQLMRLKGLGPVISGVLEQEVFFRGFDNRREVAGYLGLTPSPWQSGGMNRDQGIGKAGNPRARRIAIELSWLWLKHQPDSALTRWFKDRVGTMRGRIRRITIVAVARKLMVALWRYVRFGLVPEGALLKA